jgi:hypothetical protein
MMISPPLSRSTRGSPLDSRHVKGGNVISFSPGYCPARAARTAVQNSSHRKHIRSGARLCVWGVGGCRGTIGLH